MEVLKPDSLSPENLSEIKTVLQEDSVSSTIPIEADDKNIIYPEIYTKNWNSYIRISVQTSA